MQSRTVTTVTVAEFNRMTTPQLKALADRLDLAYRAKAGADELRRILRSSSDLQVVADAPVAPTLPFGAMTFGQPTPVAGAASVGGDGNMVFAFAGAADGRFPIAGQTVATATSVIRTALNINPATMRTMVNGMEVNSSYVLQPGDRLEFVKPAGDKGC